MYKSVMRTTAFLLLLWGWATGAGAQSASYPFSRLTTAQGLSNSQVNCLLRDSRGFLWIGTQSGLNRYDGYSFRVFRHSLRDSTSLPGNHIARLAEGPAGRIWIETRNGYAVYDPSTERFYRHVGPLIQELDLPADARVISITKDRPGNYWILTTTGVYYYRTQQKRSEPVRHRPNDPTTPIDDDLTALTEDGRGQIWLVHRRGTLEKLDAVTHRVSYRSDMLRASNREEPHDYRLFIDADNDLWLRTGDDAKGVFFVDTRTNRLTRIQKGAGPTALNNDQVRAITQDTKGTIWIGTDHGGINLLDKKTFTIRYLLHNAIDETSIAQNSIYTFYRDTDGTIWVGTFKQGISYYHPVSTPFYVYRHRLTDPASLNYDDVNRFAEDAKGNLWIGTNGGGLSYFDRATNRFTPSALFEKAAGANSVIVSLCIDHDQTLWVGTYNGGLYALANNKVTTYRHDANDPASIASNNIWELFEDRQQRLWVGTLDRGLDRFDRQQNRFYHYINGQPIHSNYISSMFDDKSGDLWVGTASGIDVINAVTGKVQQYANYTNDPNGLSNNNITTLLEDSQGTIWVGTQEGLNIFDKKTGHFRVLRQEDGLPDNTIVSIREDPQHTFWIGTPGGLSNLTIGRSREGRETYLFRNYNESDGLPGRAFNPNASLRTRRGELVFGSAGGFAIFRPEAFQQPTTESPKIVLTDLQIFNKSIRAGEEIAGSVPLPVSITEAHDLRLTHRQNVFSIEFAALNFIHPEKTQYQYKLEGFNEHWLTADNRGRKATFTNLNPGDYVFRVRASTNSQWSKDGIRLPVTVLPPFWKSPLAYVLYALFIVGLLMLARRILLERARLTFEMEQARQRAQHLHEMDEMKIKFFTNVSHEFRTPLTLIISPVEQLIKQTKEDVQLRQFQLIHRNAKRLLNLVNQLLDFRKMDVQGLTLQPTRQDIVAFCREVFYSFSDLSEKKHIRFTFDSNVAELTTVFDQDKVERILFNLLSNAFKFTPENGQVAIALSLLAPDQASADPGVSRWLTITVTDTGIGIAKDKQEKIFERFFQSDLPDTLINQGSGIGLSITREFVQLHGGTLTVDSQLDRGSVFTIRLPIRDEMATLPVYEPVQALVIPVSLPVETPKGPKNSPQQPTLLLVEDNDDFRFYLKDNLNRQYTILEAANGKEGWQLMQHQLPDLVVSDVMMPEMDGIELCSRIRADRRTAHIPVLLLTARSSEEQKLEGFETGASDYITKPFNVEILHARIKNLISQQNLLQKALQKPVDLTPGAIDVVSLDEKLIQKALSIVEKNIGNPDFSVEEMSRELGMSRVHLYKKLLALTNKSPIEFIRTIRLLRAAQLLGKSQLTVAEVAYQVGFNNPKYFTKYFKQEFGVIPSQYAADQTREAVSADIPALLTAKHEGIPLKPPVSSPYSAR